MEELTLAVCPHDMMRNPEGWRRLVAYLSGHLGVTVAFRPALDFAEFQHASIAADIAYANALDALALTGRHGFRPLVRPTDTYDEAVLVARLDDPAPSLEALGGAEVATVEGLLPTRLALRMLRARGITPGALINRDSWLSVVRAVWAGEAPYGILYCDAYEELSHQARAMVQVIMVTSERCAYHVMCGGPGLGANAGGLADTLVAMAGDAAGREVLIELRLVGWRAVSADDLATMRAALA